MNKEASITIDDLDKAYKQGFKAYGKNQFYSDNPYDEIIHGPVFYAWEQGFGDALAESCNDTKKSNVVGFTLGAISITIVVMMIVIYLTVVYF